MKEVHGVTEARKCSSGAATTQAVRVADGAQEVILALSECSYPAGLTPEQARFMAKCLVESAKRVEKAAAK